MAAAPTIESDGADIKINADHLKVVNSDGEITDVVGSLKAIKAAASADHGELETQQATNTGKIATIESGLADAVQGIKDAKDLAAKSDHSAAISTLQRDVAANKQGVADTDAKADETAASASKMGTTMAGYAARRSNSNCNVRARCCWA